VKRKTLAAETTVVDQELGQFEAVVSAWDSDREQDTIAPTAFDKTIAAGQASGKTLPLLFEHTTEAVGHIDPNTMRPTRDGLVAPGQVDRDTDHGTQVWRQIKSGSAGFSIGFAGDSTPQQGGGVRWTYIDLLEISATSTPMHPAARALNWKSTHRRPLRSRTPQPSRGTALGITPPLSNRELRRHTDDVVLEAALGEHPRTFAKRVTTEPETSHPTARELRRRADDVRLEAALGGPSTRPHRPATTPYAARLPNSGTRLTPSSPTTKRSRHTNAS
jgi:HK97 family phage prohead protease